jgi:hypothetical protein
MMTLVQEGTSLGGYSALKVPGSGEYGLMAVKGTVSGFAMDLVETGILEQKRPTQGVWCIKTGHLAYDLHAHTLTGAWEGLGCAPGRIELKRQDN